MGVQKVRIILPKRCVLLFFHQHFHLFCLFRLNSIELFECYYLLEKSCFLVLLSFEFSQICLNLFRIVESKTIKCLLFVNTKLSYISCVCIVTLFSAIKFSEIMRMDGYVHYRTWTGWLVHFI